MISSVDPLIAACVRSANLQPRLETLGVRLTRYGLVTVLLLIGFLKFTAAEAEGIQPLVSHSPLISWMHGILSVQAASNLIGAIEIAIGVMLALRPISAKASFVGSLGSVVTFLLTTSFLFSTPGAVRLSYGLPVLDDVGQFLIKDVVLLGASFWTAAEALAAVQKKIWRSHRRNQLQWPSSTSFREFHPIALLFSKLSRRPPNSL